MNGLHISLERFRQLKDADSKLDALFEALECMNSKGYECSEEREERVADCKRRLSALENGRNRDKGFAGVSGAVAASLIEIGKRILGI